MVTITKYVWDTVSDCVLSELDENNVITAVYTNEPQQYGGVLSQRRGNTSHYHHHDARGSTRFLTDSSGNVTDTYLNDAWGNNVVSTGTTVNPFKWVGKYGYYTDDSTGQVYVRARMYQATIARWCSVDPLPDHRLRGAYCYTENHPQNSIDPSGHASMFFGQNGADPPVGNPDQGPILWPTIIQEWPSDDEVSTRNEDCACRDKTGNRMRPTSPKTGRAPPVAGLPYATCELVREEGEIVLVSYDGQCIPDKDLWCKEPCEASCCKVYKCFECVKKTPTPLEIEKFPDLAGITTAWVNCRDKKNANGKCSL